MVVTVLVQAFMISLLDCFLSLISFKSFSILAPQWLFCQIWLYLFSLKTFGRLSVAQMLKYKVLEMHVVVIIEKKYVKEECQ